MNKLYAPTSLTVVVVTINANAFWSDGATWLLVKKLASRYSRLLPTAICLFSTGAYGFNSRNEVKARGDKSDEDGHRELREHVGNFWQPLVIGT